MADNQNTPHAAAAAPSQAQSGSADPKNAKSPEKKAAQKDEPQHFDTTISKLVERENADGEMEWTEVMSDNLYPGEKLKRADDEEKAAKKAEERQAQRRDANKGK